MKDELKMSAPFIRDLVKLVADHETKALEYDEDAEKSDDEGSVRAFRAKAKAYRYAAKKLKNLLIWHGYAFQDQRATQYQA